MAPARRCSGIVVFTILLTMLNVTWWQYGGQPITDRFRPAARMGALSLDVSLSKREEDPTVVQSPAEEVKPFSDSPDYQAVSIPAADFALFRKGSQPDPYLPLFAGIVLQARRTTQEPTTTYSQLRKTYQVPPILNPHHLNCRAIVEGDKSEHQRAVEFMKRHVKVPVYEDRYMTMLRDCEQFKKDRGYIQVPLTEEEQDYPLAFTISVYKNIEHVERLLRALYQPQNIYCIHVDPSSPLRLHLAVSALASCFPNVFIPTALTERIYYDVSELGPTLNCMKDLVNYHRGEWKYLINLEEKEMPLRSNWEIVQIAKIFNGANDIGGSKFRMDIKRVNFGWARRFSNSRLSYITYNTNNLRVDPLPVDVTFYRGDIYGMFTHKMVEYVVQSGVAQAFLEWCARAGGPAEYYWNTLNYNAELKVPGGYEGPDDVAHEYSYNQVSRVKHWIGINHKDRVCLGQELKNNDFNVCIFGVGDVPWLASRTELAAHRFNLTTQYVAYDCLEELHRNRTIMGDKVDFDAQFYASLPILLYSRKDGL